MVNVYSLLQTDAEVAVVLAGFASVAAVLRRPLSPFDRIRFLTILFAALIQVLASLVPAWLSSLDLDGPFLWRVASGFVFVLNVILVLALGYIPLRTTLVGRRVILINVPVTYIGSALGILVFATLLLTLVGFPVAPGFGLYYTALLIGMTVVFVMFADAIVDPDSESR